MTLTDRFGNQNGYFTPNLLCIFLSARVTCSLSVSNILSFNEQKKQDELKALVAQIPQMMQYGGQPYENTSYSYSDNTVANIRNANQGMQNSQQGMKNALTDEKEKGIFAIFKAAAENMLSHSKERSVGTVAGRGYSG